MSRIQTVKGILKTFFMLTKEDWSEMDHKLLRIAFGAVGFAIMTLFWYFFLRNIMPF